jgi:hypothetical protein
MWQALGRGQRRSHVFCRYRLTVVSFFFKPFSSLFSLLSGYLEWYAEEAKRIYGEVLVYHFGLPVSN